MKFNNNSNTEDYLGIRVLDQDLIKSKQMKLVQENIILLRRKKEEMDLRPSFLNLLDLIMIN